MDYENIIAEQYLCVPTCLSVIIKAMCDTNISQYTIANYFGVNIPFGETVPGVSNLIKTEDSSKFGVEIKNNEVNSLFDFFNLPLFERYQSAFNIYPEDFPFLVKKILSQSNSIICGFNYSYLYDYEESKIGHVSIITNVSDDMTTIELLDPGPNDFGLKCVSADKLYNAIRMKHNGLWIISKKQG